VDPRRMPGGTLGAIKEEKAILKKINTSAFIIS